MVSCVKVTTDAIAYDTYFIILNRSKINNIYVWTWNCVSRVLGEKRKKHVYVCICVYYAYMYINILNPVFKM